jgi:AraC-like DNA-binding protein
VFDEHMDDRTSDHLDRALATALRRVGDGRTVPELGLVVSRVHATTPLGYQRYTPSLSVVLAGRKRSVVGDDDQVWGREHFIITPVDLPVIAGVVETVPDVGFVSAVWQLDAAVVAEVAGSMARPTPSGQESGRLGTWTPALADAFARLVALLDTPEDVPVLAPLLSREVVLRLLQTEQAPRILAAIGTGEAEVVAAATRLLTERTAEPWSMTTLADAVRSSESTLYARFRSATGMSPMQYLKRLRLGEAKRRMVVHGDTAAQAAAVVGYRSASHFSRDYRAAYGRPPAEDAAVARTQLALVPA